MTATEIEQLIAWVIAIVTALGFFLRSGMPFIRDKIWRPIRSRITTPGDVMIAFEKMASTLEAQSKELRDIKYQVYPDSGNSLFDRLLGLERGLRVQDAALMAYIETRAQARLRFDREGNCIHADGTFARLTGSTQEQVVGWGWVNFVSPDQRDRVRTEWNHCVEERREFRMPVPLTNGSEAEMTQCNGRLIKDVVTGMVEGWVFHFYLSDWKKKDKVRDDRRSPLL
jgi:PAS domain S-box-containing protein